MTTITKRTPFDIDGEPIESLHERTGDFRPDGTVRVGAPLKTQIAVMRDGAQFVRKLFRNSEWTQSWTDWTRFASNDIQSWTVVYDRTDPQNGHVTIVDPTTEWTLQGVADLDLDHTYIRIIGEIRIWAHDIASIDVDPPSYKGGRIVHIRTKGG